MRLQDLPIGRAAFIDQIEWQLLSLGEAQRLREFGVCEGASIETLHRGGLFGRGAFACQVGRMTVAMRSGHATAIHVRTGPDGSASGDAAAS